MSESVKIKIRTTARDVENVAVLHPAQVNPEQSEEDVDYTPTSDTVDTDVQSTNLDD